MRPKKNEEQRMHTLVLRRKESKTPTKEETETKYGAESKGKAIQRLPPPSNLSHILLQNPDTIIDAHKYLLTGAGYSCHLGGSASA